LSNCTALVPLASLYFGLVNFEGKLKLNGTRALKKSYRASAGTKYKSQAAAGLFTPSIRFLIPSPRLVRSQAVAA
jgi:hypothetical protein